jgi:uncharacterized protein DUF4242
MPRYIVERSFPKGLVIPNNSKGFQLCDLVAQNNAMDVVVCVHSYVSEDKQKTFCAYDAPSPEVIRQVARRNNLPVGRITQVRILDPYFYY